MLKAKAKASPSLNNQRDKPNKFIKMITQAKKHENQLSQMNLVAHSDNRTVTRKSKLPVNYTNQSNIFPINSKANQKHQLLSVNNYIRIDDQSVKKYEDLIHKFIRQPANEQKIMKNDNFSRQDKKDDMQSKKKGKPKHQRFYRKSCGQQQFQQLRCMHNKMQTKLNRSKTMTSLVNQKCQNEFSEKIRKDLQNKICSQQNMILKLEKKINELVKQNQQLTNSINTKQEIIKHLKQQNQSIKQKQINYHDLTLNGSYSCIDFLSEIQMELQDFKSNANLEHQFQDISPLPSQPVSYFKQKIRSQGQQIFWLKKYIDYYKTKEHCSEIKKKQELNLQDRRWQKKYTQILSSYKTLKSKYISINNQKKLWQQSTRESQRQLNNFQDDLFDLSISFLELQ